MTKNTTDLQFDAFIHKERIARANEIIDSEYA